MTKMPDKPQSETNEQYALRALMIQGAVLERGCQHVVRNTKGWKIQETNYPVEHNGEASNLDIWAESKNTTTNAYAEVPIECKKNNSEFIDWIFFPQPAHRPQYSLMRMIHIQISSTAATKSWRASPRLWQLDHNLAIADEARETKGNYQKIVQKRDWTKTSNAAITDAARQISIATQALIEQEMKVLEELRASNQSQNSSAYAYAPYSRLFFFPTIVTTANLFTCQFQDTDVDLGTGEIPIEKAKLVSCPYLMFDYPVPSILQESPRRLGLAVTRETLGQVARLPVFIVQGTNLPAFLAHLRQLTPNQGIMGEVSYGLQFGAEKSGT